MDPNSLQFQDANENEPLYRAAMLAGVAVGIIIVLVLGISFVVRHARPTEALNQSPSVHQDDGTSPDDSANGTGQSSSGMGGSGSPGYSASSGNSAPLPSQSYVSGGTQTRGGMPAQMGPRDGTGLGLAMPTGGFAVNHSSEPPTSRRTPASAMRDWTSVNPENLSDIMSGR